MATVPKSLQVAPLALTLLANGCISIGSIGSVGSNVGGDSNAEAGIHANVDAKADVNVSGTANMNGDVAVNTSATSNQQQAASGPTPADTPKSAATQPSAAEPRPLGKTDYPWLQPCGNCNPTPTIPLSGSVHFKDGKMRPGDLVEITVEKWPIGMYVVPTMFTVKVSEAGTWISDPIPANASFAATFYRQSTLTYGPSRYVQAGNQPLSIVVEE